MITSKLGRGVFGKAAMVGVALVVGLGLTACSGQKKKADLAQQESAELREKIASLETELQNKDSRIAELESAKAQPMNAYPQNNDPVPQVRQGNRGGDSSFHRNAEGQMAAEMKGDVVFASGRAEIRQEARKELDKIAAEIKRNYPNATVRVEGHTDSDPIKKSKWKSNEQLSQARADAVREYLMKKGISAGRLEAVGYGASRPKATKAASRRVEIVIMN